MLEDAGKRGFVPGIGLPVGEDPLRRARMVEEASTGYPVTMDSLRGGEQFPGLQARVVDGGTLRIPEELHDTTAVLLFYRGHW